MGKNNAGVATGDRACNMPENWIDNVTAIIKTFERPQSLNRMISSMRGYYPTLKIIVTDDSETPYTRQDVEYLTLPFDSGAGRGRNHLVDQVKTKLALLHWIAHLLGKNWITKEHLYWLIKVASERHGYNQHLETVG